MIATSTPKITKNYLFLIANLILLTVFGAQSYAQTKNYAEVTPSTGTIAYYTLLGVPTQGASANAGSITDPGNAAAGASTAPATLNANYANVLGLITGEGEAYIQLKYGSPLTAGKVTYIPFDPPTITGVNVDLLNLVGDLTGLFSKELVTLEAYSGATAGSDGTKIPDGSVTKAIVRDASGRNYFAVTSSLAYNSVRVKLRYTSNLLGLSLGASLHLNVYTAFNHSADNCGSPLYTNLGEATGVNVSLNGILANPERAIDGNVTTFSQLQSGLVGVGSVVSQTVYLNGLSSAGDVAKVVLSQPGTVLTLNLLNTITLQAFNGATPVGGVQSAGGLLNLQLLNTANDNIFPVYFTPGGTFDRIKISVNNTLAVGGNILSGGLKIHEVQRTVTKPVFAGTIAGGTLSICGGSTLTLSGQNLNPAETYNFYKKANNITTQVAAANAGTYTEAGLAAGTYTYYISAQKAGCTGESDRDSVQVIVKPTLVFPAGTLTNASVGRAYSKQVTAATGGTPGYTYGLAAGSTLPAGLTISPAGLITGTPTGAGSVTFSLMVTDSFGCSTVSSFTLNVTPALVLPAATLPTGTVGTAYTPTLLPAPSGGTTPYTYTAANMPPGLAVNPATGEITGTPTLSGTFTFPVTLTDADGNTVNTSFTIVVRDPLALPPATLSDGTAGRVYPTQIIPSATGGSGVYTYSATSLPAGLVFNPATREITGTPTQSGTFSFPVTVNDNEGRSASANYTIVVKDPLVLAGITLPNGTVGVNYPVQTIPAASGGTGPYTYAAANVPPGLTFDPVTREITGTPAQSGTFTISVTVTDAAGSSVTTPYTLTVNGTLALAPATLPEGTVGTAYTAPALPAVTGGTAPYIYSMTGLPAGLNFDPATRVISGTPGTGGSFTVKMSVTDNGGLSTSTDYALLINAPAPVVAGTTICSGSSATLTVSNPVTGVTYNFYSATGNTPLPSSGNSFTTPVLNQTTTYYAEAVSGTAASARVPVTVTVNPAPESPTVLTNNLTISSGQTANLQANADANSTIFWYTTPTGGVAAGSGTTFTTPALSASTTYYAGTVNSTGCSSLSRVAVTVNVISGPTNPNCNAATSQQSNITGLLCVGCSIQNPGNSTDADLNNYTEMRVTVGLASTAYQRLIFQRVGTATDSIRLDLETPVGLADLSLLGGVTINVMNGNTVVRSYPLNNSLVNLGLLGGNRFKATVLASAAFDRVEVSYSPLVVALSSLRIYGAQVIFPDPTVVSGNQTICSGSTASLSATALGGTTLTWYSAATGGSILQTGGTYTTPALTATTTYYIEVSNNGCANPARVPVTVTVTPSVATPVLATVAPVCSGATGVLSVDNPQTGTAYKWYTTATGGTAVFTGETFVTPPLTANTTYYLEASNGNCTSATRAAAAITVNPRPVLPQVQAVATTVNQGQSANMTATSTEANVVFNWYTTPDGTTPVYTGANYVTPPLFTTTTYYVEATSSVTGCASSSRVQQTITVNGSGTPVPVLCELPVSQTNGVAGTLSVLARVDNPGRAIDGDQQTASTLSIPVGINASVFQKVNFAGLSNVGDTVRIRLTATNQLLSLSLLSGITLTTYQGATSNNDGVVLNNGIINVQLLNGGAEALISLVPAAQFDGAEVRLNSGILGALSAVNFNYARRITTAPTVTAANVTACLNATPALSVSNPQPGILYNWYTTATGGTAVYTGENFVIPAVTADIQYYVEATRNGCGGSRTAVNVTVIPAPLAPVLLSATEQTCQNANLVLQVQNPQAGVTYQWYLDNTAITGATGASYSIANIQTSGTYSVEAVNSCGTVSARTPVTVTVGSLTAPVLNPLAITINLGEQTILTASSSTSDLTYTWYATDPAVTGAVAVSTPTNGANGTFITPNLSSTTTYYVTAQSSAVGGCISPAASVVVTVNPGPTNPGSVPCEPAISQTVRSGGTLSAGANVSNPGFAVDNDVETSSSLFIPFGVNSFVAQKVNFTGLSQIGDTVRVRLSSPAGRLSATVGSSITLTTYNGAASNNDERAISSSGFNLQIGGSGTTATIDFVPAQAFDGVELKLNSGLLGALSSVNFNYARRIILAPTPSAANVTVCEGSQATLAVANPAAGITYKWYDSSLGLLANTATYQTPATLAAGVYTYYVSANRNGCESAKVAVTVTVIGMPAAPVPSAANPAATCINTPVTLNVDAAAGVTYNWYDALTGGNLLASNTSSYTTSAFLAVGITDFYVEAVNSNSCLNTAARTKVSITIRPDATEADLAVAGAERTFCAGSAVTLTASSSTITNPVFTWYTDAALTNAVFTGATFNIASIPASTNFYVTVRGDEKCENTNGKLVTLTVNPGSTAAEITISGIPASLCSGTAVTLTASTSTVTNPVFTWYTDAALTNAVFTGPVYTTDALTGNTNFYVTVQGSNRCPNTAANAKVVQLTVNPPAVAADINVNGVPASACAGSGATLTASSTTVINPVFTWYTDAALSNAVFTGAVYNTPSLNAATTYYVTVSGDNKCENVSGTGREVVINMNPAIVFNGGALPSGTVPVPYIAQINPATGGTPGYTYIVASGNTLPAGLSLTSAGQLLGIPTVAGNYTFAITASDNRGCNATAMFTISIGSVGLMTLPPATLADGLVDSPYTPVTLPAPVGGTAPYTYVANNIPPGFNFDTNTRVLSGTPTLGGTFNFTVTATDANGLTATTNYTVVVNVTAPVVANAESCNGSSALLTVTNPTPNVTYNWYASASGGTVLATGTTFQTPAISATTTYYAEGASGTARSARTPVTVTLKPSATAADLTITGIPANVCSGSGVTLTASSTTVTNPVFTWYSDVALTNVVYTGDTYQIPSLTANTNFFVSVRGDNKCENESGSGKAVALSVNPAISFEGTTLSTANTSSAYSVQINPATGGTPGYTYSVPAGSTLPAGLTLSASGVISGTPTTPGTYTFALAVTDSKGCVATANFNLVINGLNTNPMVLPPANLPNGEVGTAYNSQVLPAVSGGNGPFTYVATNLPPGLGFDPLTRTISGIPTTAGTFTFTVTVTDATNATATANYTVTVTVPAPVVANATTCGGSSVTLTVQNPVAGVTYNWYNTASGGTAIATGTSFQTDVITANTTYYAEGLSNNVVSSRTPVNVNLGSGATSADIIIAGEPVSSVCSGAAISLTASSTTVSNPVFTWYSDAALANAVFTGPTFNIPSITAGATYYVTVRGDNQCENAAGTARVVTLAVNPAITFNTTALPDAVNGTVYSTSINQATGGTPGYTYTLASGSTLPAGLSLSAAGTISGTPTVTGNYTFSITATDTKGCNATAAFALNVGAVTTTPLALPPATLPNGVIGTTYAPQTLPAATGGTGPFSYVATNLPPGLTFNPATREITGTPTLAGTFSILLTVTDGAGATATANYTVVVTVPAPVVANASTCSGSRVTLTVQNPVAGVTYNWYNTASGGTSLATGTSFQTDVITASTIYYAEGSSNNVVSSRTPVNVTLGSRATSADIIIIGEPASSICSGAAVSLTASSTTVTNPVFTWYTDAALTNAVFTGTTYNIPSVTTGASYYVTVRGDNQCENAAGNARVVTLTVNPALTFNTTVLPAATNGTAYAARLNEATGGTPGYTYTLASGSSLPGGLSLSATGIISGTPAVAGNYTFSVTASDTKGCNATASFSLSIGTVTSTPLSLPPATLSDGIIGTTYTPQTLPAAAGGTGPFTYVATGLPPGLTFNPVTREITGIPTLGGTFNVVVTVTDGTGTTATATYVIVVRVPNPVVLSAQSCDGTSATLTVSNPVAGVTYNWYAAATGGNILATGTSIQTPAITASTSYYVEGVSGTAVSSRTMANVVLLAKLATPVVTRQSSTFTSITFSWNAVTGAASYEISRNGGTTWETPSSGATGTTHLVFGLQSNEAVTLQVRAKGTTNCQTSDAGSFTSRADNGSGNQPENNDVFVPNTFTPNGDGNNDIFYAYGSSIVNATMRIYDQWGHVIFISRQMNMGWDGTYRGQPQPNGVYIYMIDIDMRDGTKLMRKGTVTLLK
ncbi:MAG: putative Ig domain-containing protein [Pedobacter sp.]|uniref:Ig-like domain-containing protein n=1 Tax=Pedobacter sp. TaxID=1411316 RepID=UPI003396D36D